MKVQDSVNSVRRTVARLRGEGRKIGLVPTMGALHKGHASLMRRAREECDVVYASIFVNPAQFAPTEDFKDYPRPFDADCRLCEAEGVDYVFAPTPQEMYGDGFQTYVSLEQVTKGLCGASRPTFFRGVATVCVKLFNICSPHYAYFGQKDFQQCLVILRMVKDLNLDLEIRVCPTAREDDGLAVSSRNIYLNPAERQQATCLYRALTAAREDFQAGETDPEKLIARMRGIIEAADGTRIDYLEIVDPDTVTRAGTASERSVLAVAVWLGRARLIDNMPLTKWP
ncbi:MAG TPA: pantoate--beta-alanine ligase [Candidatus Brocadiia bacterium]|nr:pantoate--beta-alanine ligase [Candidatus Brocadiia bacterium]